MKIILSILLLSTITVMTRFTYNPEKLKSKRVNQFHFDGKSEKWLTSGYNHCEIWQGKKQCDTAYFYFDSNSELFLEEDIINSGYFRYNYKKEAYQSRSNPAEIIKKAYPDLYISSKTIYEHTQSVLDREKERLAITLRHRATRIPNFVESKELPRCLVGLIDTKSDTVIKLASANLALGLSVERTKDYVVVNINDELQVWDILSGESILIEALKDKQIDEIATDTKANYFIAITRDGTFFKYDIESKTIENIFPVEGYHKVFILNQKDTYLVVTDRREIAIYSKNKTGEYSVKAQFTIESNVNDVFYDTKTSILYVATNDDDFPITRYLDVKIIGD